MTGLTAVLACVSVVVIGLGVSLAAFPPGDVAFPTRIASVFGLGCASVIFAATLLVLLGIFGPVQLAVLLIAMAAGSWAVGFRRGSLSRHAAALREELRTQHPFVWLGLAALVLIAASWAAVAVLPTAGGWRYWADGLELADAGGVPSFTAQWGDELPPAVSKLGGNAFLGSLSFLFSGHPFTGMAVALWLSVVGYAAGLFALAYELGLRWTAPAVALLGIAGSSLPGGIVLNAEIAKKLEFFQHEDLGRMLAAVGAAIVLARTGDRPSLVRMVGGGVVLAAGALTHLIPVIAFAALIGGALVPRLVSGPARRKLAGFAAFAVAVTAVLTATPLALARGEVGFSGATDPERYTLVEDRYDPTALMKGLTRPPRPKSEQRWYESPGTTARLAAEAAIGRDLDPAGAGLLAGGVLLAALAVAVFGTNDLRSLVGGAAGMAAALVGVALLFSYRYDLWAQATFGERRLFEYASVPLVLIAVAGVELGAHKLAGRWLLAGHALALGFVLAVAIGSVGALGVTPKTGSLRYIAAAVTTPCDSRLLVDHGTRGTFQALTGRISVIEGLVPFLRPSVVNEVLVLRADARRFMEDPDRFSAFLTEEEIDFVLAHPRPPLNRARSLRLVHKVDGIGVYKVARPTADSRLPQPSESPGYDCVSRRPS